MLKMAYYPFPTNTKKCLGHFQKML